MIVKSMLFILVLSLIQLFHVNGCETSKDGVSWTFDESVDDLISGVETFQQCQMECEKKESCTAFTFQEGPLNFCFLFPRPSQPINCTGCRSGLLTKIISGSGCTLDKEHIIKETVANSVEDCMDQCEQTVLCTNFLYFNSSSILKNFCYLYNGCTGTGDCEDCQSGELGCFPQLPEECTNYKVLDDPTRNNQHGYEDYCDQSGHSFTSPDWQGSAWYRLEEPAGTKIPTDNPGPDHCGTASSGWIRDQHPTVTGEQKNMTVCFSWRDEECWERTEITATNCGGFFVYFLTDTPGCNDRYCGSL